MIAIEKIAIFGATGMTGICVLQQALTGGFQAIKLLVRDLEKLPSEYHNHVEIIQGNVTKFEDVDRAVEGVDAVIVVLGTRNNLDPTTELSTGMENIIKAMRNHGVNVVSVCLSAFLFYSPTDVPSVFKNINEEHKRMLILLKSSNLSYIAVFPPHISDNPKSEYVVKHGASPGGRVISKYELADFLITSLSNPDHYGKVVGICSLYSQPKDTEVTKGLMVHNEHKF